MILKDVFFYRNNSLIFADLEIEKDTIKNINTKTYKKSPQIEKTFFVTPGFVNAHLHPNKLLTRGLLDGLNINDLLSKMHISAKNNYQSRYNQSLFILMDAILSGATSIYAVASNPLPVIKAFKYYGLQGAVSCFFNDSWDGHGNKPLQADYDNIKQDFAELYETYNSYVHIHIGTASVQSASNRLLQLLDKLANEFNTKVNLHIAEGEESVQTCLKHRKYTPVRLLDNLGVLNSKWNLIHVTNIDTDEVDLIAKSAANVILCPVSNAKTGVGVAPIKELINKNVNLALGTDACSNNNTNNILSEAYIAQLIFNAKERDASLITEQMLIKWLTLNSRKILGIENIGEIAIGMRADLLLWSMNNISFIPHENNNYYAKIFYGAPDIKPHTVIIGGTKAVENYKFLLIDRHEILNNIR